MTQEEIRNRLAEIEECIEKCCRLDEKHNRDLPNPWLKAVVELLHEKAELEAQQV